MVQKEDCECEPNAVFELARCIADSNVFIALATKNYIEALKDGDSPVSLQVKLAKKHNRPVIILVDNRLSENEKIKLERYFVGFDILGVINISWSDEGSSISAMNQIKDIINKEMKKMDKKET